MAHISHPHSAAEMTDNFLNENISIPMYNAL